MTTPKTILTLAILAILAAGCVGAPAAQQASTDDPDKIIRLALAPTSNPDALKDHAEELDRFLESQMAAAGRRYPVEIVVPASYAETIEMLGDGRADAALMSAWPAQAANKAVGAEIALAEDREVLVDGQPIVMSFYYSYYIVHKDSPYQKLSELRGKAVAYPSETSTSGYIFPVAELVRQQLIPAASFEPADPGQFFGEVVFAGSYGEAWEKLRAGEVDVAVTAGDVSPKLLNEIRSETRVIATQGPVPSHAVVFASDFDGAKADALKAAMLELKDERRALMQELSSASFVQYHETTTREHVSALGIALVQSGLKFE